MLDRFNRLTARNLVGDDVEVVLSQYIYICILAWTRALNARVRWVLVAWLRVSWLRKTFWQLV